MVIERPWYGRVATPDSPELQPAERLWPLTNEAVANTHFDDLMAVDRALADRCCALANDPDRLKTVTWFHWCQ